MAPHFFRQRSNFFVQVLSVALLFVTMDNDGQNSGKPDHTANLIIGAFSIESNTPRLVELAREHDLIAQYRKNEKRGLYYVFIEKAYTTQQWFREQGIVENRMEKKDDI